MGHEFALPLLQALQCKTHPAVLWMHPECWWAPVPVQLEQYRGRLPVSGLRRAILGPDELEADSDVE
jgi:hypothetical protein